MTFILPSFGASAISAVPGGGGGGASAWNGNTYSVEFDGTDDYMDTGSTFQSTFQSSFSFSLWVKLDSGGSGTQMLFAAYGPLDVNRLVLFATSLSSVSLFMESNDVSTATISGSGTFTDWSHIVGTFEQSGSDVIKTLYVNGSQASTQTKAGMTLADYGTGAYGAVNPYVGARNANGTPNLFSNVQVDELAIIPSALSASDVTAIYNNGVPADLTSYSPVAWYRMGDNDSGTGTTITDQGSGGNDGTLINGPTFSTDVLAPFTNTYSLEFDGTNDYLDLSSAASLLNSQSVVTMSFWYYADDYGLVAGARASNTDAFAFWPYDASNFYWIGRNGGGGTVTASNPGLNQWVHCVAVQNGTSATLYLTPTSTGTTATTTGTLDGALSATLGNSFRVASDAHAGSYFNGKVDEVAVWNSALSASDVTTLYNSGVPGDISSLNPLGWWRMGDNNGGTGTTITDQGSGGNDGTLTNGPTFSTTVPS